MEQGAIGNGRQVPWDGSVLHGGVDPHQLIRNDQEDRKRPQHVNSFSPVHLPGSTAKSQQNAYTLAMNFLAFIAFAKPSI